MSSLQSRITNNVRFNTNRLYVSLTDRREISVPLSWFPRLLNAIDAQRQDWELIGQGVGIHWEDISVAGLLGLPND